MRTSYVPPPARRLVAIRRITVTTLNLTELKILKLADDLQALIAAGMIQAFQPDDKSKGTCYRPTSAQLKKAVNL